MSGLISALSNPRFQCACADYRFGVQNDFSAFHVHTIVIFQNHAYIQNLECSPSKCISLSEMSRFVILIS